MPNRLITYLDKIDLYWKRKIFEDRKDNLSPERLSHYRRNSLQLNKTSNDKVNTSLINMVENGDLPEETIKDLYVETIENNSLRIKLFKLDDAVAGSINFDNIINSVCDGRDLSDRYNLCLAVNNTNSDETIKLIYINRQDNELRLAYRFRYSYDKKVDEEYEQVEAATPIIVVINKDSGLAQIRVRTATKLKYDDVYNMFADRIKSLLSIEELEYHSLQETINHLFNQDILVKFEGVHSFEQTCSDSSCCNTKVKITIEDRVGEIDYTNLPIFNVIRNQRYTNSVESIKGTWNYELEEVQNNFIKDKRAIFFNAFRNEIQIKSDYMEQEVQYVLSKIR